MGKHLHVTKKQEQKNWRVMQEGNSSPLAYADTQQQAFLIAREIAKDEISDVIIHRPDGRIGERGSYGNDPYPPQV